MLEGWTADSGRKRSFFLSNNCSIYFSDSCDVALRVSSSSGKDMKWSNVTVSFSNLELVTQSSEM